ncbi:hypothetical protein FBU30_009613 [Linnemannia zychae]|nr:hypothetical protein FBU30_009613 [Linnemannia zychae]
MPSATAPPSSTGVGVAGGVPPPPLPGMMMMGNSDPSMQLFNPSEQRYFSEFLDTLVVDQDFTFDPSSIPNLPNLPLFTQDTMPGGFNMDINNPYRISSNMTNLPGASSQQQQQQPTQQTPQLASQQLAMDFDVNAASNQPYSDQQASVYIQHANTVPAKRTKTNKGTSASAPSASVERRSTPTSSRPSSLDAHTSMTTPDLTGNRIATPIQQLSKLSLNQTAAAAAAGTTTTSPTKARKNKREDDPAPPGGSNNSHPYQRSSPTSRPQQSRQQKEGSRDRNTSNSDEDDGSSDSMNHSVGTKASTSTSASVSSEAPTMVTPKRKPYKELLTEEEKRANHIASEQKRRNTIRNGFKDMTDIIPELKDVNSSKSTILFKAVDFIKHLEKRNRMLQEKASQLESRLLMQKGGGQHYPQQIQSQSHAHNRPQQHNHLNQAQQHSSSPYRVSPYDSHPSTQQQPQQSQHPSSHIQQQHQQRHHQQQNHSHHPPIHLHSQPSFHNSDLDDKRLQEIPNLYPVSMSR